MKRLNKKRDLGQFFTKHQIWLQPQVIEFISNINIDSVLDPFAGGGDLLKVAKDTFSKEVEGYDVDRSLNWGWNDSLLTIPKTQSMILTNPPYYAKHTAFTKKSPSYRYFEGSAYDNLYQIALEKCLAASDYVVAIIPESFLVANVLLDRLQSITVLEENPFEDTTVPVCVVCYGKEATTLDEIKVYKGSTYCLTLKELLSYEKKPSGWLRVRFNDVQGQLGIRCIDGVGLEDNIRFCLPSELDYDISKINKNSRFITVASLDYEGDIHQVIEASNRILNQYRMITQDLSMLPFRSNKKNGVRRRRVDFKTVRAILEEAIIELKQSTQ